MTNKNLILSSAGLQNIKTLNNLEDDFIFITEEQEIKMKRLYAEFISPRVTHLIQTDQTINSLSLKDELKRSYSSIKLFTPEVIDILETLSQGLSVNLNEEISHKLRILSIILWNEELYNKIDELFPFTFDDNNLDQIISFLQIYEINDKESFYFLPQQKQNIIDIISSNFYKIDRNRLLTLSKRTLYSIISNEHLKITNEDSLVDFIEELFSLESNNEDELIQFYENVKLEYLSEKKFNEFIEKIKFDKMTNTLWMNFKELLVTNFKNITNMKDKSERYSENIENKNNKNNVSVLYDNNPQNSFKGIIYKLGDGNPKKVGSEKIIEVTSSSNASDDEWQNENVFDFYNDSNGFHSKDIPNSWFCYDFKNRKIKLTSYSMKTHSYSGVDNYRTKSWVVEGSNDQNEWVMLDSHSNESCYNGPSVSKTFNIENSSSYYKYIRIKQTGKNRFNCDFFVFSAIEFFGSIREE